MIGRDESHLFREREVEKEDTTMRAITRLIVDIAIRAHAPPGMRAIYFLKLLIHRRRYENGNCTEFATKRHRRHKNKSLTVTLEQVRKRGSPPLFEFNKRRGQAPLPDLF
jgi:hypothetical protein